MSHSQVSLFFSLSSSFLSLATRWLLIAMRCGKGLNCQVLWLLFACVFDASHIRACFLYDHQKRKSDVQVQGTTTTKINYSPSIQGNTIAHVCDGKVHWRAHSRWWEGKGLLDNSLQRWRGEKGKREGALQRWRWWGKELQWAGAAGRSIPSTVALPG